LPEGDHHQTGGPAGIGLPAGRALTAEGYTSLEQLRQVTAAELGRLHGVGPMAVRLLREALAERGLSFANADLAQARPTGSTSTPGRSHRPRCRKSRSVGVAPISL
jgi:hypothetical protein